MAGNSRRVLKSLTEQINKSPLLFNASTAIGNATERAQQKISNLQSIASEKYDNIVKVCFFQHFHKYDILIYFFRFSM